MIVSWNELQRTCQKAFRGLGVPAGVDDDSAFSVLWLQARGLDALTPLVAALAALKHTPPRPLVHGRRNGGADVLDAGGQPAVSIASDTLDFAVARAIGRGNRVETRLINVESGIFVAGAQSQRPIPGYCMQVEWRGGNRSYGLDVACNGECRLRTPPVYSVECNGGLARNAVRIVVGEPGRGQWMDRKPVVVRQRRRSGARTPGRTLRDSWYRSARRTVETPARARQTDAGAGDARIARAGRGRRRVQRLSRSPMLQSSIRERREGDTFISANAATR